MSDVFHMNVREILYSVATVILLLFIFAAGWLACDWFNSSRSYLTLPATIIEGRRVGSDRYVLEVKPAATACFTSDRGDICLRPDNPVILRSDDSRVEVLDPGDGAVFRCVVKGRRNAVSALDISDCSLGHPIVEKSPGWEMPEWLKSLGDFLNGLFEDR